MSLRNEILLPAKDDPDLPDYYGIIVYFIDKSLEEFQGTHAVIDRISSLQILTKDDEWLLIPLINIKKIEFDQEYSKYQACLEKRAIEEAAEKKI